MVTHTTYQLNVQKDFVNKQTPAKPVIALAELIWNSLDADATTIEVRSTIYDDLMNPQIIVEDNGTAFTHDDAPSLFQNLGGSWKRIKKISEKKKRYLHGAEGKGRLKAFSLGKIIDWYVTYRKDRELYRFKISMSENDINKVKIFDEEKILDGKVGVRCVISDLKFKNVFLDKEETIQELSEIFAVYLRAYKNIRINLPRGVLDYKLAVQAKKSFSLNEIKYDDNLYDVEMEVIVWNKKTDRKIYLCNKEGLPLSQSEIRVQVPGFNFSAYIKSEYFSKLSEEGLLDVFDLQSDVEEIKKEIKINIKDYYREYQSNLAKARLNSWKEDNIYQYANDPKNLIETVERQVFDIVAVNVENHLPNFNEVPLQTKKLHFRLLRQAIERSPEDLQIIFNEVLELPDIKKKEFASLLKDTSLTSMITATKVVSDREKLLSALEILLFREKEKKKLLERSQLHPLLAENTWIFGEEFSLTVSDKGLTEVLRKHIEQKKLDIEVDGVKRIDGKKGIVDLMLTRSVPCGREAEHDYLVVELKRPQVVISSKEINQVESYAHTVVTDERFHGTNTRWTFWVISTAMDDFARSRSRQNNMPEGLIFHSQDKNVKIWVKTWSEVLESNKFRLKFFSENLNLDLDRDEALNSIREKYRNIFENNKDNDI